MSITLNYALNRYRQIIKEPFYSLPSYSTGTVTVVNGSATVTGSSTLWASNAKSGNTFNIAGGKYYHVLSITSDTVFTLTETYAGTGAAGASYTLTGGRVTNATAVDDLNAAEQELALEIGKYDENIITTTGTISYVSGTELYAFPTTNGTIKTVIGVIRTDLASKKVIHMIPFAQKEKYTTSSSVLHADSLDEYCYLLGSYIGIVPVPTTSATNNVTIYYIPESSGVTTGVSTFSIPDAYKEVLVYTAAIKNSDDVKVHKAQERLWKQMISTIPGRQRQDTRMVNCTDEEMYH